MQIDCAAVPASARHEAFPAHGVLYFFLDLRWGHSNGFRVLYAGDPTDAFVPASIPAGLSVAYGYEARFAWRWMEALDEAEAPLPKLLPKWPFDPLAIAIPPALIETWRSEIDEEQENPVFWWPELRAMDPVLLEAQEARRGVATPIDAAPPQAGISRPYATYPQDWRAVEIGAALLLGYVQIREISICQIQLPHALHDRRRFAGDVGADRPGGTAMARASRPARSFRGDAGTNGRDAFWSWLESWRDFSAVVIQQAARLSIEAALAESAEAASAHPQRRRSPASDAGHALATRHRVRHLRRDARSHAGAAELRAGRSGGNRAGTHLLLLELSSNEGLGHHFGEGVYQFWILPDDLRARRFDRVMLTTTGY